MKKISFIPFAIVAVITLAAGCQQREIVQPSAPSHYLTAFVENRSATRSQLGQTDEGKYFAFWSDKDELAVYVDGLNTPDKYILSQGAGAEKGVFAGTVAGRHYVALYPYSDRVEAGLRDNVLSLVLPAVQDYSPDSFGEGAFPMLAVCDGDELQFKNLCAALRVSMTGDQMVKSIRFVAHDDSMAVSGPATVRTDYTDAPELVMSEGGSPSVSLKCYSAQLVEDTPRDFYLVIPAGTYQGGFSVEVETFSGTFTRTISSDVTFVRSQFRYIAPFRCDADGEIDPDDIPSNQIWYSTSFGDVFYPEPAAFDRSIVSNTYADGRGVIVFDGPVTNVGMDEWGVFSSDFITDIKLPNCVESIGDAAFQNSRIESFHTPDNLKSVGRHILRGCNSLTRIYGPHASPDEKALVTENGAMVGYAFGALGKVLTIPEGVKTIAEGLFQSLGELETVVVPESLVSIGQQAFTLCHSLREFRGNNDNIPDGRTFINPDGELAALATSGLTDYVMPGEVRYFGYWIFTWADELRSITFPSSLSLDDFNTLNTINFFRDCNNLEFFYGENTTDDHHCLILSDFLFAVTPVTPEDYKVPSGYGISETNGALFRDYTHAVRVTLADEIRRVGAYSFSNMPNLRAVTMPARLSNMENDQFYRTTGLDTLYLRSYAPPVYYEFNSISGLAEDGVVICVPRGFEGLYKTSTYWAKYADRIVGYSFDGLPALDYYISTDFSRDGNVKQLQKAKKGNGIDIVLMGDGFSDRQIADGTYAAVMDKMADAFFSEEPYTSHRDLFNVYSVDVVSMVEGYDNAGQALSGWFGDGTEVGGDDARCMEYALGAVSEDRMDNTLIIVAMNSTAYAGTCYMHGSVSGEIRDYACGTAVAYFPIGTSDAGLAQLVHHEAGGHGFAKLDDEYAYEENGTIPAAVVSGKRNMAKLGWWKNVDFTNDPEKVKWARFLKDERYKFDGLGVFEGASTYIKGAWRPTENSIMRYNTGGFNAPSREAIWYRIHKLAYGDDWQYDYEEFVAYDAVNRKTSEAAAAPRRYAPERPFTPTAPPVVTGTTWREALAGEPVRRAGWSRD